MTRSGEAVLKIFSSYKMVGREYKWYVLYTRSQHEKQLHRDFGRLGIESYLPLVPSIRFWSDRKKVVDMALFPNYLFVRASCREYSEILVNQSVFGFVKTGRELAVVPESTIEIIKTSVDHKLELSRCAIVPGKNQLVTIINGPLRGFVGEVIDCIGKYYLLLALKYIGQYLMIRISIDSVSIIEDKLKPCAAIL